MSDDLDAEFAAMHAEHTRAWINGGPILGDVVMKIADLHDNGDQFCPECNVLAPCPTYRIITSALGGSDEGEPTG